MRKISLFLLVAISFSACSVIRKNTVKSELPGLASPIQLGVTQTRVPLQNYFLEPKDVTALSADPSSVVYSPQREAVFNTNQNYTTIFNLNCETPSAEYDIPVFASDKKRYVFTYVPHNEVNSVFIAGGMNGWNKNATELTLNPDGSYSAEFYLQPGLYPYRIWENGTNEMLDANNPNRMPNGLGAENSYFEVGSASASTSELFMYYSAAKKKQLTIECSETPEAAFVYFENRLIPSTVLENSIQFFLPSNAKLFKRAHVRVYAYKRDKRFNDVLIPLQWGRPLKRTKQLTRKDTRATVMYFAMVDRFRDGNSQNNRPTNDKRIKPKANNLGGDLAGLTEAFKDGYFKELGVNTLWISPITRNAEGAWGLWTKGDTSMFSGYHGYWPTSLRKIDNRFGTEEEFKVLLSTAHKKKTNVYLDYVAHHVHQEHPLHQQHPDWSTSLYLPDGTMNTERWDDQRLTTWFDVFLPTWDFAKPEVVDALTDTALFWVNNYELDGFRHDATKHIRTEFWTTLTRKMKASGKTVFQIGETYGSPELIRSYIGSEQLDAQFDFNLYDAAVDAFAKSETGFENLARVVKESQAYYGAHHQMGNITGNQDRTRFISYADGSVRFDEDQKLAGWTRDIQNNGQQGFDRLEELTAFLMAIPGIPCLYYGDEIGLPGANDPDNRRMMQFSNLNTSQQQLHDATAKLIHLRRDHLSLMYGDTQILRSDAKTLVMYRVFGGERMLIVFSKEGNPVNVTGIGCNGKCENLTGTEAIGCSKDGVVVTVNKKGYAFILLQ